MRPRRGAPSLRSSVPSALPIGDEVVITDRGRPIARLSGIDVAPLLDRLTAEGRISAAPAAPRPTLRGRRRVEASGGAADLVVAERAARR
jgi:antitoxin (DNA-binding transcriptional repressor) of toxin-antitoxin stability system